MPRKRSRAKRSVTLPTREEIRGNTIRIIAACAKRDPAALTGEEELAKLGIPDSNMPFLRNTLLGYMQFFNEKCRLRVTQLRKPKQTINGVVLIVQTEMLS